MNLKLFAAALFVSLAVSSSGASAALIAFAHTGNGSGTLDGIPFGPADFIIAAVADTDDRESLGGNDWFIDHILAQIDIDGLGTFDFVTATRTFKSGNIVGFSRHGAAGDDLYNGPADPAFVPWDMQTTIGPITGDIGLLQWDPLIYGPVMVTDGIADSVLAFNDAIVPDGLFLAIGGIQAAVPEPGSLAIFGIAFAGLAIGRRVTRRRA